MSISLPALERAGFPTLARLPFSLKVLLENLLRREDEAFVRAADIKALGFMAARRAARPRDLVHARARAAAGFHRRALRRRYGGDARRHHRTRRRSGTRQPAAARRTRDRSLGAGRPFRTRPIRSRSTPASNTRAIVNATCFCAGARRRFATSASFRPRPASSIRSTSNISRASCASETVEGAPSPIPTACSAPTPIRRW